MSKKLAAGYVQQDKATESILNGQTKPEILTPAHRAALQRQAEKQKPLRYVTLADKIAEDTFFIRNYKYYGSDKQYPETVDHAMRTVSKAYPYAKGGLLLVDEPLNELEMIRAYEKAKTLKKLGFRFVVVERDSTLDMLLEQLGEL